MDASNTFIEFLSVSSLGVCRKVSFEDETLRRDEQLRCPERRR
jgi:hypothetical protein